ncbi:MAG: S-layer family protein, partial [Chlorobium sp.]|nr:S-layer family protein [Chlorobium sp.]
NVALDASSTNLDGIAQSDVVTTSGNGNIVLRTTAGSITLNDGTATADDTAISANGSGNILIQLLGGGTDITVNADIITLNTAGTAKGTGNISVLAARSITFTGTADIQTTSSATTDGSVDIQAGTGSITQSTTSLFRTTGTTGAIRLLAATDVTVGDIESSTGTVSITATAGSIIDADALISGANDNNQDITANGLRLNAGTAIGASVNHLETTVTTLSARAGNGSIYLLEADGVTVDNVGLSVNRVASDATTSTDSSSEALQSDIRTTGGNGNIVLRTTVGSITLNDGTATADDTAISANGSGNILIQLLGGGTDITVNADIITLNTAGTAKGTGNISVLAARSITFTGTADIQTTSSATTDGSVDIQAGTGSITQSTTSLFRTTGTTGAIRLLAATDVTVGDIESSTGTVSITATAGSILDADALIAGANDNDQDITANGLRLNAGTAIGASVNHLETMVTTLSARAANGSIYLLEADGVTVDNVGLSVNRVASDATTSTGSSSDAAQSDIRTTGGNGNIVLRTTNGSIVLNDGTGATDNTSLSANGRGNILVQSPGGSTDITVNADIVSGSGHITLLGGRSVLFTVGADITTTSTGTINLEAGTGFIQLSPTSNISSGRGDIRLYGSQNITLGGVVSTTGNVSMTSTAGSILDGDAGDSAVDIASSALRLSAAVGIGQLGSNANAIDTAVDTLTARATSGGINLFEANQLTIDDVSARIQKVGSTGGVLLISDDVQSDVRTTGGNGSIVLQTMNGALVLHDGTASADNVALYANGSGNILLRASGSGNGINADSDVKSDSGHVTVVAAGSVTFNASADVTTGAAGTLALEAATGSILLSTTSNLTGTSGDIRLAAAVNVTLGALVSTTGNVSVIATSGSVLDGDSDGGLDIRSTGLRLVAGDGIGRQGVLSNPLETSVAVVSGRAGSGIALYEKDSIAVGDVSATVKLVDASAGLTLFTDTLQSDLRTTSGNGAIVLRTINGDILLNDGTVKADLTVGEDNTVISASGNGNILLQANGTGSNITAFADVISARGYVTLYAANGITFSQNADITTGGIGTLDLEAQTGSIALSSTSKMSAGSGDIRLFGLLDVTLGDRISTTGIVSVTASTRNIIDGESAVDVSASGLILKAGNRIGSGTDHLETQVATLSANSGAGGLFITESDGVTVDKLTASLSRVAVDGTVPEAADVVITQEDLKAAGAGHLVVDVTVGDVVVNAGTPATNAVTAVSGNTRLTAHSGALTVNARIDGGSGHVTILSSGNQSFGIDGDVATTDGSINVESFTITMADGATITSGSGNIRLVAVSALQLGSLSTTGDVSLSAGTITDAGTGTSDTTNITADEVRLVTTGTVIGNGAGTNGNHLELNITKLAVDSNGTGTGGLFLTESNSIQLGSLNAINVYQVTADGTTALTGDTAQSNVISDGHFVLVTTAGSIETLAGGVVTAAGNILMQAGGTTSDLMLGAAVISSGNISLNAVGDIKQNATIAVATTGGTIDLLASGSITMGDGSSTTSTNGNIRYQAGTNVTIELLAAGSGNVALYAASGFIIEGATSDSDVDITANGLLLNAATVIGAGNDHLETAVTTLAASAGGGIFITENNGVTVGSVSFDINRISSSNATSALSSSLSDLTTSGVANVVLVATTGDITLTDGADGDNKGVDVSGTGNVRLEAKVGAIELQSVVTTGGGNITLLAGNAFTQAAAGDISTAGSGTVNVEASMMSMVDGATITSGSGNIRLVAVSALQLGSLSTTGDVSLSASTITDAGAGTTDTTNITADELCLVTTGTAIGSGAGSGSNYLELNIAKLAADINSATTGGLFVTEANSIQLGSLNAINVYMVAVDGSATTLTGDGAQSNIISEGHFVLVTTAGSIELLSMGGVVTTEGNMLLQAGGTGSDLTLGAAVTSNGNHITLKAADTLSINSAVAVTTSGSGTLSVDAEGGALTMAGTATMTATGSSIRLNAATDVTLGNVVAANVSVVSDTGSIINATGSTKNVTATNLRLQADDAIGASNNHLT